MIPLDIRESVSAATHGLALLVAIPAAAVLLRRARGDVRRQLALAAYAFGLTACLAASTASHALVFLGQGSRSANTIDHIGIYLLIAGTYTPIAAALLPSRRRRATLVAVWLAVALGAVLNILAGPLPPYLATSFYLAMGWGGLWCYMGVRCSLSHRELALIPLGGVLYSVGAACHVLRWPVAWPGVFGAHELFHVFVIAGATAHFLFIWRYTARPRTFVVTTGEAPAPVPNSVFPVFTRDVAPATVAASGNRGSRRSLGAAHPPQP